MHTLHNIDKEIDAWGVDGVIQCLKSLCLYYFDSNDLDAPQYVVDAGKEFDINDYTISQPEPPSSDNPYVVVPLDESNKPFSTPD